MTALQHTKIATQAPNDVVDKGIMTYRNTGGMAAAVVSIFLAVANACAFCSKDGATATGSLCWLCGDRPCPLAGTAGGGGSADATGAAGGGGSADATGAAGGGGSADATGAAGGGGSSDATGADGCRSNMNFRSVTTFPSPITAYKHSHSHRKGILSTAIIQTTCLLVAKTEM
jgi:hypothetical protein